MNLRLKKIMSKRLNNELKNCEIIQDERGSIWFIDRKNMQWYLQLDTDGHLWWRYDFFTNFYAIFSLERGEFGSFIREWVSNILNCDTRTSSFGLFNDPYSALGGSSILLFTSITSTASQDLGIQSILKNSDKP